MPKGIYERKTRKGYTMSEAGKEALRKNAAKAAAARREKKTPDTPAATAAKRRNAGKAAATRTARAILKHLPVGASAGTTFQATRYRRLTVIDTAPVKSGNVWEQKFHQTGSITMYGSTVEFDNDCRIVWTYQPNLENIMDSPMFEEPQGGGNE